VIRILHAIATLEVGGVERQLAEFLARSDPGRFDHRVVCLTRGGPLRRVVEERGVPVQVLAKAGRWDARVLPRLVGCMERHRPDLVHTYLFTANFWGRIAAWAAGVPGVVSSVRCLDPAEMRGAYLWADRLLARRADRALAVSAAIGRYLEEAVGVPASRVRVVPNAKDPADYPPDEGRDEVRAELGVGEGERLVGLVGRLHPQKGHDLLIEAAPAILARVPEARFLLLGEGPWAGEVDGWIRASGLGDRFLRVDRRPDVARVLAATDVVVLPSRYEGFPNVVVEAMAARRPVVATRIAGTDEAVVDGETGLLVPPEDPEALAGALVRVLQDDGLAGRLAEAGRRRFLDLYTMEGNVRRIEAVYEEAVSDGGAG